MRGINLTPAVNCERFFKLCQPCFVFYLRDRNHLTTSLTDLKGSGLWVGVSIEISTLIALRVFWAWGVMPSANMPVVWRRIARAELRWCSNDFELVSRWCCDKLGVTGGYWWGLRSVNEGKSFQSFVILLFKESAEKGCRICDKKFGWRPICIGRKGFIGWGWGSGKVVDTNYKVIFTNAV